MTVRAHVPIAAFVFAAVWLAAAPDARADAIDGMWCQGSRSMQIDGPAIVTPGGISMTGEYDLDVTVGEGPTERWRRCKLTS